MLNTNGQKVAPADRIGSPAWDFSRDSRDHPRDEVTGRERDVFLLFWALPPQQMCPVMSWLLCLCLWVSVSAIQLCQAAFYDTVQQHPGLRPGRTTVHAIGESPPCLLCLPQAFIFSRLGVKRSTI